MKHELIKEDFELLPSVGCVINTKTGDTFPIMDDNSIEWNEPHNVVDMSNDSFNSQEWFDSLHSLDLYVVGKVLKKLKG